MTFEGASRLFRQGRFRELIDAFVSSGKVQRIVDPKLRVLLAYVMALADETPLASSLASADQATHLGPSLRSQSETTVAIVAWRSGDLHTAWRHLQASVRLARESGDVERIAWAHLHWFRFAIEAQPVDVATGLLRETRSATVQAAIPYLTAYLHICVSVLEGQRGHLDEAWRHCDIAESLLQLEGNAWVMGSLLVNRGCIACLRCEFEEAGTYNRGAIELSKVNGSLRIRAAAEITSGHIQMLCGEFAKAQQTLLAALGDSHTSGLPTIGARDSLARVFLALAQLDDCDSTLGPIGLSDCDGMVAKDLVYAQRWAGLTRAKLLLRRGRFSDAGTWLDQLAESSKEYQDQPFDASVHLLAALALSRSGQGKKCAHRISSSVSAGITDNRDLQGQFYHSVGEMIAEDSEVVARHLQRRAQRIWSTQRIVSVRHEIGAPSVASPGSTTRVNEMDRVASVVNSLSSAFDLAYSPDLLGDVLLDSLEKLGNASGAKVSSTASPRANRPPATPNRLELSLGNDRTGKAIAIRCDCPDEPLGALLLSDVFRIGRAAVALEKARQEERSRAAIWPATPIEEQAGALFVAEEMQALLAAVRRVATTNIPILITGETGTGKEVVARLIHGYSPRAARTFLPFNLTATPRDMLDAQLFGHRRGAFTGATEHFSGVIRAAAGGTLFLDEIGETTLDVQPKLLRFLESGEVHPIGDAHPQRVDVRVIAATNADLETLVSEGRFREDLFYRLNIVRLHVPPLRERRVDIPAFANLYLQKYAAENGKGDLRLSEETMEYLLLYRWPGNVRQLANEMRRLVALAEPGAVLMPEHLSQGIAASRKTVPASERTLEASEVVVRTDQPLAAAVQHVGRTMVQRALAKATSVDEAARMLGLSRKGLYLKRLRFGLEIDRPRGEVEVA